MKPKIKNLSQLRAEKARLAQVARDLEDKIQHNWADLKQSLYPPYSKEEKPLPLNCNEKDKKTKGKDVLKSIVNFAIGKAANALSGKAEIKLDKLFRKK